MTGLASFFKGLVAVRQFIDSFPTVVSDYAQASGPARFSEGKIMNGMIKSKKRKCDLIPAVQGT